MEALKVTVLSLLAAAAIASYSKPLPDPQKAIQDLEQKYSMKFKAISVVDGDKVWIFQFEQTLHGQPVIVELPPFPSETIIKWAAMSAAGELELIYLRQTQQDQGEEKHT